MIVAGSDNSIHVIDARTNEKKYVLLGGSVNPRNRPASYVENPNAMGCTAAYLDELKIVGIFGNMIRVYSFDN